MGHNHDHHSYSSTKELKIAFFLNLSFTLVELVGGFATNSISIISDALHDLGDSLSLGMAWYLERYSQREATSKYSYGYRRFSLLGAFINAVVLIIGSIFVLREAIPRLLEPETPNAGGMIIIALIGVAVNGAAVWRLRRGAGRNVETVSLHLLEDVLGWVAVLIVSIILFFFDVPVLDPILSMLIALFVLYNVLKNLGQTAALFLQAVPREVDLDAVENQLRGIESVLTTHHTHIWSLDGEQNVLTTHLVVPDGTTVAEMQQVKKAAIEIAADLHVEHSTVEVELENEDCRMRNGQNHTHE